MTRPGLPGGEGPVWNSTQVGLPPEHAPLQVRPRVSQNSSQLQWNDLCVSASCSTS